MRGAANVPLSFPNVPVKVAAFWNCQFVGVCSLMSTFLTRKHTPRLRAQLGRINLVLRVAENLLANVGSDQACQRRKCELVRAPVRREDPARDDRTTAWLPGDRVCSA